MSGLWIVTARLEWLARLRVSDADSLIKGIYLEMVLVHLSPRRAISRLYIYLELTC
jgi:hypothetical protein